MYLILLVCVLFLYILFFNKKSIERFEDELKCYDEETKKLRKLTKEEQKELEKEIEKGKTPEEKKKEQQKKDSKETSKKNKKEVFLIYNKYNYYEAREICKLFKGSLATEEQLDDAFKKGANWCSWGWLDKQMVAYPVQEDYWTKIENSHKGFCGPTAGISKMKDIDPEKKFSVHCYGIKPKKKKKDDVVQLQLKELKKLDSVEQQIRKCRQEKIKKEQSNWLLEQAKKISIVSFKENKWSYFQKK